MLQFWKFLTRVKQEPPSSGNLLAFHFSRLFVWFSSVSRCLRQTALSCPPPLISIHPKKSFCCGLKKPSLCVRVVVGNPACPIDQGSQVEG